MKLSRLPMGVCVILIGGLLGACGGDGGQSAAPAARLVQPPAGVPADTDPLPLPEQGKAYNNPQPRDKIQDGGTLRLAIAELGPNFNRFSIDGGTAYVQAIMTFIAPELWEFSVTGLASPNPDYLLSAELISDNPETVKFTLNPKAHWNDGMPIDWTAFDTTWKTQSGEDARYNPAATDGYRSIGDVRKGDADNEVIVTFKEPFYPYEYLFGELEHPRNQDPDFYKTGWVNNLNPDMLAGAFTIDSLSETRLVLKRNPSWWGEPAKLDRVVFTQMEDQASINAFQNGEIDAVGLGTADRRQQIRDMQNVQIRRGYALFTAVYTMGRESPLFSEEAARRAFVLGTDRELLVEIRYQGMDWQEEPPGSVLLYPWQDGYEDNLSDLHFDPKEAARILDEAGWKLADDGFRYRNGEVASFRFVTFGDDPLFAALARAQQKMAQDIGLKMEIDTRKGSDFSKTVTSGDFDVVMMGWSASDPFGWINACQLFCSDSESNFSRLGNAEIDALLRKPGTIANRQQAIAAANVAERQALHLIGTFPLFNGPADFAVKKGLANYGPAGFASPDRKNIGWEISSPAD